jgi:hypothetical protein
MPRKSGSSLVKGHNSGFISTDRSAKSLDVIKPEGAIRSTWSRESTLHVTLPCGQTLVLALALFGLLIALGETLVRTKVFRAHVVANARGGQHRQFELQLGRLETIEARDGAVDCILLGNSMVWMGFDPEAFSQAYRRRTGQAIRCFSFGVDGLPTASAGALTRMLADDYQPNLLIYGTSAQDYSLSRHSQEAAAILDMPWLRYRLGEFSMQGWFYDHSCLCQYWETLGHLVRLEKQYLLLTEQYAWAQGNYGFGGREGVRTPVSVPPAVKAEEGPVRYLFELLSEYQMLPENLSGLEQVAAQNGKDVQVLIVEMPVPPAYLQFFTNGQRDYARFVDQVASIAESGAVPFLRTGLLQLVPDDGWWDYSHMNTKGAYAFSEWLGEQVGSAVVQGRLQGPLAGP